MALRITGIIGTAVTLGLIVVMVAMHGHEPQADDTSLGIARQREHELEIVAQHMKLDVDAGCRDALISVIANRGYTQGVVKPGPGGHARIAIVDDWHRLTWICY